MDHQRAYRTSNNYRLLAGDFIRSRLNIDPIKIKYAPKKIQKDRFDSFEVFVVVLFTVLLYRYYKKNYDNNVMEFKKENVDIDVYFFSELYLKKSNLFTVII